MLVVIAPFHGGFRDVTHTSVSNMRFPQVENSYMVHCHSVSVVPISFDRPFRAQCSRGSRSRGVAPGCDRMPPVGLESEFNPKPTPPRAIGFFNVGWDQLASSAAIRKRRELMVGLRGEAPLVPPYYIPPCFKKGLALTPPTT